MVIFLPGVVGSLGQRIVQSVEEWILSASAVRRQTKVVATARLQHGVRSNVYAPYPDWSQASAAFQRAIF